MQVINIEADTAVTTLYIYSDCGTQIWNHILNYTLL